MDWSAASGHVGSGNSNNESRPALSRKSSRANPGGASLTPREPVYNHDRRKWVQPEGLDQPALSRKASHAKSERESLTPREREPVYNHDRKKWVQPEGTNEGWGQPARAPSVRAQSAYEGRDVQPETAMVVAPSRQWQNRGFTMKKGIRQRRAREQTMEGAERKHGPANMVAILSDSTLARTICTDMESNLGAYQDNAGQGIFPTKALSTVRSNLMMTAGQNRYEAESFGNWRDVVHVEKGLLAIRNKLRTSMREYDALADQNNAANAAAYKHSEIDYLKTQELIVLSSLNEMQSCFVANTMPEYNRIDHILKLIADQLHQIEKHPEDDKKHGLTTITHLIGAATDLANQGKIDENITSKIMDFLAHFKLLHLMYTFEHNAEYYGLTLLIRDELHSVVKAVRKMKDRPALYEVAIWSTSGVEIGKIRMARASRYIQRAAGLLVNLGEVVSRGPRSMFDLKSALWGMAKTSVELIKGVKESALKWAKTDPFMDENTNTEDDQEGLEGTLLALAAESGDRELIVSSQQLVQAIQDSQQTEQYEDDAEDAFFDVLSQEVSASEASISDRTVKTRIKGGIAELLPLVQNEGAEYNAYERGAKPRFQDEFGEVAEIEAAWLKQQNYPVNNSWRQQQGWGNNSQPANEGIWEQPESFAEQSWEEGQGWNQSQSQGWQENEL